MAGTLSVLGIRHHGPGSARVLVRALDKLDPTIVLVEGPPDAADVLAFAAHQDMTPPVALLVYENGCAKQRRLLPVRDVLAGVAGAALGARQGCPGAVHRSPAVAEATRSPGGRRRGWGTRAGARSTAGRTAAGSPAPRSSRRAGARGGVRRRRGLVGPPHRRTPRRGRSDRALRRHPAAPWRRRARSSAARREIRRSPRAKRTCARASALPLKEGFERIAVVCGAWHAPVLTADALKRYPAKQDDEILKRLPNARPRRPGSRGPTIVSASTRATAPASPARGGTTISGCTANSCRRAG